MHHDREKVRNRIISLLIDNITYKEAIQQIVDKARNNIPSYACFANAHMIVEAYHDSDYASMVNGATWVLPDGVPLLSALNILHSVKQERIAGMDVMPTLFKEASDKQLRVFLFGTTPQILDKICARLAKEYPTLQIAGYLSPPFDNSGDQNQYVDIINESKSHLIFVALGCPKQEKWMAAHSRKIRGVLLGVGGAFPVFAGTAKRAPAWMRKAALEWLFRLAQEPRRLLKRYFITNTTFLWLLLREKWRSS